VSALLSKARHRASKAGLPFDLDREWAAEKLQHALDNGCPYLGIPIVMDGGKNDPGCPSIDKVIPERGYVKDNCVIVSYRANTLKRDATPAELMKIALALQAQEA
jgi:hypothetical protein